MELRLYGDYGWQRPTNLGCGRRAQRRWTLYRACRPRVACLSRSNPQFKLTDIIMSAIARNRMKYWEIIADNLSKAGWSWGCVSAIDSNRRAIFVADAHRDDGKRFIVRADQELPACLELESAIQNHRA
jgi:hypothetical protein